MVGKINVIVPAHNAARDPAQLAYFARRPFHASPTFDRHGDKHDPESRKHFCYVKEYKYSGSYREDQIISHMKNYHPEFILNGKVVPWRSCLIRGCTYEGHYTKEVWDAHQMGFHSESFANGKVIPWKDCTKKFVITTATTSSTCGMLITEKTIQDHSRPGE